MHKWWLYIVCLVIQTQIVSASTLPYDPTRPMIQMPERIIEQGPLALSMIVLSGKSRYAVINGNMISEGDRIEGYVVMSIQKEVVELKGPTGIDRKLRLVHDIVKFSRSTNKE